MEYQFEILIGGEMELLTIKSTDDLTFTVFKGEQSYGDIYSTLGDDDVKWHTTDLIAPSLVKQIGERIENLDL